ncbi:hypothetical protein psyc5s11_30560 [Clostridium gelidum]|uniref:Guanylate cyclase domain-containing protein n=1 Tax=Clostridium gelidum TaxID=704125 RepID=A0ABM7T7Q9_9CLOT|nr:hypothetical protein [Clostridium gelidum]BCZ46989.1 hypothetical protein psyc5s11_30560 [Clostridium gelidum]
MENAKDYEKRIVVFMDILGFKEHIKATEEEKNKKKIFRVMNYIKNVESDNYKETISLADIGREVTVFSDSIVISYLADVQSCVYYILIDIIHIQLELAVEGIIVRGGIALGELYHKQNIIFGPAMLKAYKLESKYAIYPRIIFTEDLIKYGIEHHISANSPEQELEYLLKIIDEDKDGYYYTNFLLQYGELDELEYYYKILDVLRKLIVETINNSSDKNVIKKYKWLKKYYNRSIKKSLNNKGITKYKIK